MELTTIESIAKQLDGKEYGKDVDAAIKAALENDVESFVVKAKKPDERVADPFRVVKHIIDVRLQEKDLAEKAAAVREKKQKILAIIADKENQSLKDMDLDGLRKLLEEV